MNGKRPDVFYVYLALSVIKSRPQDLTIEEYIFKLRDEIRRKACSDICHGTMNGLELCAYCHDSQSNLDPKTFARSNQTPKKSTTLTSSRSTLQKEKVAITSHLAIKNRTRSNSFKNANIYDYIYEYARRIKSITQQDDGNIGSTKQCLSDSTTFVQSVVRAISDDDGVAVFLPIQGSSLGHEVAVPPFATIDVQKMHLALSELVHTISNSLMKAEALPEGMRHEENAVQRLSPLQSYLDLLHFMLQTLLRTTREERHLASTGTSCESAEPTLSVRSLKKTDFLFCLLRETIISLSAEDSQHQYIFDEFIKFLFIHVAQGLHYLEFAHSDMDDIEHQIQQFVHIDFKSAKRKNQKMYAAESIYIIKVLATMLTLAPCFYGSSSETIRSCLPNHSCPIKESTKQIGSCKRYLQKLLAEIAFGCVSNSRFGEFSISPYISKYQLDPYPVETVGIAERFKRSLWILVGWDILQSNPPLSQIETGFFMCSS